MREGKYYLQIIKWSLVIILLTVAIVGNFVYQDISLLLRLVLVVCLIVLAGGVALITEQGKLALAFAKEARVELRKVVWPNRHEAMQTTLVVIVVSVIVSLILWGLDSILVRMVSLITALRF